MTKLSVNINKIATLRNARGGNIPDVILAAKNIENYGAQGITIHPRPDERHIKYSDVYALKPIVKTELNIEGYPTEKFLDMVLEIVPQQVTLVPDAPDALTSNQGWQVVKHNSFLNEIIETFKSKNIRTSLFVETNDKEIEAAAKIGVDRIELYTEPYAANYTKNKAKAIAPFIKAAETAKKCGLGLNAGHDLSLENLKYLIENIPYINEVSIGHALIADALYFGLENTVQLYIRQIKNAQKK